MQNAPIREGLVSARRKAEQRTFDLGEPLVDLTKALSLAAELEDAETITKMQRRRSGQ